MQHAALGESKIISLVSAPSSFVSRATRVVGAEGLLFCYTGPAKQGLQNIIKKDPGGRAKAEQARNGRKEFYQTLGHMSHFLGSVESESAVLIRGLPLSSYAKFSGFETPSPLDASIHDDLSVLSYAKIGHFFDNPLPLSAYVLNGCSARFGTKLSDIGIFPCNHSQGAYCNKTL